MYTIVMLVEVIHIISLTMNLWEVFYIKPTVFIIMGILSLISTGFGGVNIYNMARKRFYETHKIPWGWIISGGIMVLLSIAALVCLAYFYNLTNM